MTLMDCLLNTEYLIQKVELKDAELESFLFSLGCYSGEPITVIARTRGGCTVAIKDGRYHIDKHLSNSIFV